jgi:hypothetical protein
MAVIQRQARILVLGLIYSAPEQAPKQTLLLTKQLASLGTCSTCSGLLVLGLAVSTGQIRL